MPTTIQLADGPFEAPDPIAVGEAADRYRLSVTVPHPVGVYRRHGFIVPKPATAADARSAVAVLLDPRPATALAARG